jgi:hypothetical protein
MASRSIWEKQVQHMEEERNSCLGKKNEGKRLLTDDYDDHVGGVRLCLMVNCGHQRAYCSIPQVIYKHRDALWNDIDKGKLLIRPP